jgi:nitrate/TMAO reductase-like tetraheme cytochrome c subunit
VIAELTHSYSDPKVWEARRSELAAEVIAKIRAQNSVTCRSCHDASAIKPASENGRVSHALLRQGGVTCIDCHTNIVHAPPSEPAVKN